MHMIVYMYMDVYIYMYMYTHVFAVAISAQDGSSPLFARAPAAAMAETSRTDEPLPRVAVTEFWAPSANAAPLETSADAGTAAKKQRVDEDDEWERDAWSIDGSDGHYHHLPSLRLVMWAQILYIVSLVVIIPTAAGYAAELGNTSAVYFGTVVGVSSIINPLVSRLWNRVLRVTSLGTVLQINALINLTCSLLYVLARFGYL